MRFRDRIRTHLMKQLQGLAGLADWNPFLEGEHHWDCNFDVTMLSSIVSLMGLPSFGQIDILKVKCSMGSHGWWWLLFFPEQDLGFNGRPLRTSWLQRSTVEDKMGWPVRASLKKKVMVPDKKVMVLGKKVMVLVGNLCRNFAYTHSVIIASCCRDPVTINAVRHHQWHGAARCLNEMLRKQSLQQPAS